MASSNHLFYVSKPIRVFDSSRWLALSTVREIGGRSQLFKGWRNQYPIDTLIDCDNVYMLDGDQFRG